MSHTALLVIDVQTGFFEANPPIYQGETMLQRIQTLTQAARTAGVPVIYIRHDEVPEIDGPLHPSITPRENDPIIPKMTPDSFHGTTLQQLLTELGITELVLAGFQTEYCIQTTARRAHELGYEVTVINDAHSTFDTPDQAAIDIITRYNEQMGTFAQLVSADTIKFDS